MRRSRTARAFRAWTVALAITMAALPSQTQAQEQITICHRTGSTTAPWVFMTIDARLWPEYEAQGDKRATTLAECTEAPAATAQPAPVAAQQQPVAPSTPVATPTSPPPTPAPTPVPTAAPTAAPMVETAGIAVAQAEPVPEVSSLPKSGGEPDRRLLVASLLAIALAGFALQRLARSSS